MRKAPGRRSAVGTVVVTLALVAAAVALAVVLWRGPAQPGTPEEQAHAIAAGLRCPVCQNLSVADSSSSLAQEMRRAIAADLRAGRTAEEVRAAFVAAYGEWILLSPSAEGINLVAWVLPVILLLGGTVAAALAVRRWSSDDAGSSPAGKGDGSDGLDRLSPTDRRLLERELSTVRDDPE